MALTCFSAPPLSFNFLGLVSFRLVFFFLFGRFRQLLSARRTKIENKNQCVEKRLEFSFGRDVLTDRIFFVLFCLFQILH
jgi:hypothetical protein